jgi:hypothetical protein
MYPAYLRSSMAAGLESASQKVGGETPSQFIELYARTTPRVGSLLATLFAITFSSPSQCLSPFLTCTRR